MQKLIGGAASLFLGGAWWLVDRLWGDRIFAAVRPMIPDSIANPPVLTLLDWVISYGPLAVLTVIGGYMLWLGNREISALAGAKTLAGHQELLPDWPIRNLFFYINPDVLDPTPDDEAPWQTLGNSIRDAFALGQLKVWGRRALDSLAPLLGEHTVLVKIEPTYWESAELTYTFFFDDENSRPQTHIWGPNNQALPIYTDLRVNQAQAESVFSTFGQPRLSTIEKRIGAFWDGGNALVLMAGNTDDLSTKDWADRVEAYLTGAGLLDEAVMFKTLPTHKDRMNKLRRIWGRAAERARHA